MLLATAYIPNAPINRGEKEISVYLGRDADHVPYQLPSFCGHFFSCTQKSVAIKAEPRWASAKSGRSKEQKILSSFSSFFFDRGKKEDKGGKIPRPQRNPVFFRHRREWYVIVLRCCNWHAHLLSRFSNVQNDQILQTDVKKLPSNWNAFWNFA